MKFDLFQRYTSLTPMKRGGITPPTLRASFHSLLAGVVKMRHNRFSGQTGYQWQIISLTRVINMSTGFKTASLKDRPSKFLAVGLKRSKKRLINVKIV